MIRKRTTSSNCSAAAGPTLIEVVAAISILGVILVGIVMAKSRHTRQLATAQRQLLAAHLADELIARWWADSANVPINQAGVFAADRDLQWRTALVRNEPIDALGAQVVRVEVFDANPAANGSARSKQQLFVVDLVVHDRPVAKVVHPMLTEVRR